MRKNNRKNTEIRDLTIEVGISKHAEGSCLIKFGDTHVLCTATIEEKVPSFMRGQKKGWLSAEYGMLPRSTGSRMQRDNNGKPNGRALEIQRLIGRSLRMALDMSKLGERQILIDCDVLQADGSTRCASISGGFVALSLAVNKIMASGLLKQNPIISQIAAVSCGIYLGEPLLDIDYDEDSKSTVDSNFILNHNSEIVEIQTTAEGKAIAFTQMEQLFELAKRGCEQIREAQNKAILAIAGVTSAK